MSMCRVISCVVERGCLYDQCVKLVINELKKSHFMILHSRRTWWRNIYKCLRMCILNSLLLLYSSKDVKMWFFYWHTIDIIPVSDQQHELMFLYILKCSPQLHLVNIHLHRVKIFMIKAFKTFFLSNCQICNTLVLLPGKSHGQRSLVGCSPWGRWESDMTERLHFHFSLPCIGEGNDNPLQCSCLENPRDEGACWAAVYGVAQNWTRLKRLSSSSSSSNYSHQSMHYIPRTFILYLEVAPFNCLYSFLLFLLGSVAWFFFFFFSFPSSVCILDEPNSLFSFNSKNTVFIFTKNFIEQCIH